MQNFLKFLCSSLQNSPFPVLKNFDDYFEFYTADIMKTYKASGKDRTYDIFKPVSNKNGIYIFFNTADGKILYISAVGNKKGKTGFYKSTQTGVVPQLVNGTTPTIKKYFNQNISKGTSQSFEDYINNYSILFLCLKPAAGHEDDFSSSLIALVKILKTFLQHEIK